MNDRVRAAFLADLAVLTAPVEHPDTEHKIPAVQAAELRFGDYSAWGFPSGGGSGGRPSGVADPTCSAVLAIGPSRVDGATKDRADFDYHAKMAAFHVKHLAQLVARARPVPPVAEPPVYPCQNNACDHVCSGVGNDRLVKPARSEKAYCPRCRMHWVRESTEWPKKADGTDVRGSLKPLAKDSAA